MFAKYCHVIETKEQMDALVQRINKNGLSEDDLSMAKAGSDYVLANFTWAKNLEIIKQVVGIN
ncbi:hypothetical protein [Francisella sciaenopsi]|uniref:Uncharacterized protein n=1 Tax=Francisella sciaenopsi TaxID=3055034 RepID=A0ABQ6PIE4_9GAMM